MPSEPRTAEEAEAEVLAAMTPEQKSRFRWFREVYDQAAVVVHRDETGRLCVDDVCDPSTLRRPKPGIILTADGQEWIFPAEGEASDGE